MSLSDPVLPSFEDATVCRVDFVVAAKVRDDAGIWKPLATLRQPALKKLESVVGDVEQCVRALVPAPFSAPIFCFRRKGESRGA